MAKMQSDIKRKVKLVGIADIMFDRYPGDNKTQLQPEQMMYFDDDGKSLVMPSINIMSFLCAINTVSAPKLLCDNKTAKKTCLNLRCSVIVQPFTIPLTRDGKQIVFNGFDDNGVDTESGIYIHNGVARLKDGIPNPKQRPTVKAPWELNFEVTLLKNDMVNEDFLLEVFQKGGMALGLGTFRGVFGKFVVEVWE